MAIHPSAQNMSLHQIDAALHRATSIFPRVLSIDAKVATTLWISSQSSECRLAFFKEGDLGDDGVWDIWRLEGPSFVWHFRGTPHVHVWVNVADDPSIPTNARG